mmetsp:Transcript_37685/g.99596  ORF Transcript_37685/g.99596 Transcript_37685/m.99596 type:complete len:274 (-) Transcript_37685:867-1688(-)
MPGTRAGHVMSGGVPGLTTPLTARCARLGPLGVPGMRRLLGLGPLRSSPCNSSISRASAARSATARLCGKRSGALRILPTSTARRRVATVSSKSPSGPGVTCASHATRARPPSISCISSVVGESRYGTYLALPSASVDSTRERDDIPCVCAISRPEPPGRGRHSLHRCRRSWPANLTKERLPPVSGPSRTCRVQNTSSSRVQLAHAGHTGSRCRAARDASRSASHSAADDTGGACKPSTKPCTRPPDASVRTTFRCDGPSGASMSYTMRLCTA